MISSLALLILSAAMPDAGHAAASPAPRASVLATTSIALPGGPPVIMDYLAVDPALHRIWIPAGNTGRVDVLDEGSGEVKSIEGFPTATHGKWKMGPSAATVGQGFVYIGNRADSKVCAVDAKALTRAGCVELKAMPDGLAYVARTKEVWATTPKESSFALIDVSNPGAPKWKGAIKLEGSPEGYAVDEDHGILYTNLEDKDRTLGIDVTTHKVITTWDPECGAEGPRGLAVDPKRNLLVVACTDKLVCLGLKDGKILGKLDTGAGVDNIDYDPQTHLVYVTAGKVETFTLVDLSDAGALKAVATAPSAKGSRVVVAGKDGTAYAADSTGGRLVVIKRPAPAPAH